MGSPIGAEHNLGGQLRAHGYRHPQHVLDQISAHLLIDSPTDHSVRVNVDDGGQVEPSFPRFRALLVVGRRSSPDAEQDLKYVEQRSSTGSQRRTTDHQKYFTLLRGSKRQAS